MGEEPTESLWVRIKGRAGTGNTVVTVCYRPPNQEHQADEALCRQTGGASLSQALVLMGTSTTSTSVGETTQQEISNPGPMH